MSRWPSLLTAILFASALALRAWVPAGWMPLPGAHDFAITPCPAADAAPAMDMGHRSESHGHSNGDCFSPLLAGMTLPDPPTPILAASAVPPEEQIPLVPPAFNRGQSHPLPHSTGPPEFA